MRVKVPNFPYTALILVEAFRNSSRGCVQVASWCVLMLKIRHFKKPNSLKTSQPISINFSLIETRIFSLQFCEEFLLKFDVGNFLRRFKNSLKISLPYAMKIFPRSNFNKN